MLRAHTHTRAHTRRHLRLCHECLFSLCIEAPQSVVGDLSVCVRAHACACVSLCAGAAFRPALQLPPSEQAYVDVIKAANQALANNQPYNLVAEFK